MTHPTIKIYGKFGYRELDMAAKILDAASNGKKSIMADRYFGALTEISCNPNSGNVYAIDEGYNCVMLNGGYLDVWFSSPYSGHEGFYSDIQEMDRSDWHEEDKEWFQKIALKQDEAE